MCRVRERPKSIAEDTLGCTSRESARLKNAGRIVARRTGGVKGIISNGRKS
jgi:hypothetical protein